MTTEAKVGAFTLIGIIMMGIILVHLSGFHFGHSNDYALKVGFSQVLGLNPSADVRFAGVPAGKVESIKADGSHVMVTLRIKPDIRIPRGSKITIAMSGVMGEKFVGVTPADASTGDFLQDGDYVEGMDEQGMDTMVEGLNKAVLQVQTLLQSMNDIIGDPAMKDSTLQTAANVRDLTANMKDMTATLSRMALNNESDVRMMVHQLNLMSGSLMRSANSVEQIVNNFSGAFTSDAAADIRMSIANIASASERIDHMAASLEDVVTDPQTAEDLRQTLHNTRQVTEKANNLMNGFSNAHMETGIDAMYSGKDRDRMMDFDLSLYRDPNSYFRLGIDDIGDANNFSAVVGKRRGDIGGRMGIIDSKPGLGIDAYAGPKWTFSADAYDINDVTLKLRAQYQLTSDTYLVGQVNHVNDSDKRATYFGVRHTF